MHRPPPGQYVTVFDGRRALPVLRPGSAAAAAAAGVDAGVAAALRRRAGGRSGRLDAITALLPNAALLLYSFVRKEAVLSSQIEGTQSSLADLLLFEIDEQPGVPLDDAHEVSRYVAALERGLALLRGGLPLCGRLLCEVHAVLLDHPRGRGKAPGEFRSSAVWIGGTRPGNAAFVPPPAGELPACLAAFERFSQRPAGGDFATAQGGAGARAVRDHPPLSRRQTAASGGC
jgi:Fic family protein